MNRARVLVLGFAAVAALAAIFLVKGLLGGGADKVKAMLPPPKPNMREVLVAAAVLPAGKPLFPADVKWQQWPRNAVDAGFITHDATPDLVSALRGTVVREPFLAGQPLTLAAIVHAEAGGFLSAAVTPGMRGVSVSIAPQSAAGGFVLPNDRVDVISTVQISDSPKIFQTRTLVKGARVLAVDQIDHSDPDKKALVVKTATLELTSLQAEQVNLAQAAGTVSLSLRSLGDLDMTPEKKDDDGKKKNTTDGINVVRYGISHICGCDQGD
jgi:pilus assembly protein CpaB